MVQKVVRLRVEVTVNEGQLETFRSIAKQMVAGAEAEPGTLGYEWFAGADGASFTLLETYEDARAVETHFMGPVVQQLVPRLAAIVSIKSFEIYGDPGPRVTQMASALGGVILPYVSGINR